MPNPDALLPFNPADVTWTPVSPRLTTVRLITLAITTVLFGAGATVLLVLVGAWWSAIPLALILALAAWSAWLIPRQVRALGYAERDDDFLLRSGIMSRTLVVVPYGRMQFVDVQAGPLDRAFSLAKVQLHTASAGTDAVIPGLTPQEAARLRDRLASRGEARLAGL